MESFCYVEPSLQLLENIKLDNENPTDSSKDVILKVEEVEDPSLCFLDLPREIRDEIYSLLFVSESPMYPSKHRARVADQIALLRTNRKIYSEAVEVLYGKNTFQIRGEPRWAAPEFLHLLNCGYRDGFLQSPHRNPGFGKVCLARYNLRKLHIPSHGISLDRLKQLFSLLKHFPKLEYLQVIYLGSSGLRDMDVVGVCRLLRDRLPLLRNLSLCKRISYLYAEDISWMVKEKPYKSWFQSQDSTPHMWGNQHGDLRVATVVEAPQNLPE